MTIAKYVSQLSREDILNLCKVCFHITEEPEKISVLGHCVRVFPQVGSIIDFWDYSIETRRRGFREINGTSIPVEELYIQYMYEKFGTSYLEDCASYACNVEQKEKELEMAKKAKDFYIKRFSSGYRTLFSETIQEELHPHLTL